ncbi:hypothetical protein HanIR_Chr13g0662331 [Helianthus annuus]|nr:hypothetical protein HanIR_Chr13g0662331 [Helianthus annuus]
MYPCHRLKDNFAYTKAVKLIRNTNPCLELEVIVDFFFIIQKSSKSCFTNPA